MQYPHLFYRTTSHPTHHLRSRINRTTTTLGEGVLATLLATPTNSTSELYKRQHTLQTLLANEEVVAQLETIAYPERYQSTFR
ncbi:MAG: hypothetical protein ROO73_00720 [Roseivirga sp.]